MTKTLNTRDALLKIRQFVTDDSTRAQKINELGSQIAKAISERTEAAAGVLGLLEGYVAHQSAVHGFDNDLEKLESGFDEANLKRVAVKTSKVKTIKKVTKKRSTVKTQARASSGAQFTSSSGDEFENLSPKELNFVELLCERGPRFTSTKMLVSKGIIPAKPHATAKVNQLRKKGVPIESARQARVNDQDVSSSARGYRLISS